MIQSHLNDYRKVKHLGTGGNGEVWLADGPDGQVALKILKGKKAADSDKWPRFQREVQALRKLKDVDGVLPLLDAGIEESGSGKAWFTMPVAVPLRQQLGSHASLKEICRASADLAGALARVHDAGIVHRDIKPDNLYWYREIWCLGDFGLADFEDAEPLTRSERKLGPAYFIAPEMLNDAVNADGRPADIYSLAKTIWVLATGQNYPLPGVHDPSFAGASIRSYLNDSRSSILDELLKRMTVLDPSARPAAQSVERELLSLSEEALVGEVVDPSESLNRLRAVASRHLDREKEARLQVGTAEEMTWPLRNAIGEISRVITSETGLSSTNWYSLPNYWGFHRYIGGPSVVWDSADGVSFEAGGKRETCRFSIGIKAQLLSDGQLVVHAGYKLDRLLGGRDINSRGQDIMWNEQISAPNGMPSCVRDITILCSQLKGKLPRVLETFAELIEECD